MFSLLILYTNSRKHHRLVLHLISTKANNINELVGNDDRKKVFMIPVQTLSLSQGDWLIVYLTLTGLK